MAMSADAARAGTQLALADSDLRLIGAIQDGLPLVARPYAAVGTRLDMSEAEVCERLRCLEERGVLRRLGVVVRHHELGFRANAMVVWDVPDDRVDEVGQRLSASSAVTLCYRRPRRLPHWPYNLFSMVHGLDRDLVLAAIAALATENHLEDLKREVLFSTRRFKQRGARYLHESTPEKADG